MNPGNTRYDLPQNYYFGGGGETSVTPLAGVILIATVLLMLWLPRRRAIVPLLAAVILLPSGTTLVIAGLHFAVLRVLVGAGWLRLLIKRDIRIPRLLQMDRYFLFWSISNAVTYCLLWMQGGAITNRLGFLWTTLGSYFLVRTLIRDREDIIRVIRILAVLMIIIGPVMMVEHLRNYNAFAILGAPAVSSIRYGAIRAQGPFAHSIIAGTVGAMLIPLFAGLGWFDRKQRLLAGAAILSSMTMMLASASSTPLLTFAAGIFGLLLFPARERLKIMRWGLVIGLVLVQLCMKAPIWFLIARIGGSIGGSGYHRAQLIDTFVRHFSDWWLVGTRNNASWGWDMWDIDNAYVGAGIEGGLITFALFITILVCTFRRVGRSMDVVRKSKRDSRLMWSIGTCVFANVVGFFGIVYFDQSILIWYSVLAMVSATAAIGVPARTAQASVDESLPFVAVPQPAIGFSAAAATATRRMSR